MSQDTVVETAMKILLGSGESRKHISAALTAVADWDFTLATAELDAAQHAMRDAHALHTDIIQGEAGGASVDFPALFSHAQDTMMATESEIRLVKRLLPTFQSVGGRLTALEETVGLGAAVTAEGDK